MNSAHRSANPLLHWLLSGWLVSAVLPVFAQPMAPPAGPAVAVPPHCVGDDPLPMSPDGLRAWLDESDRSEVLAALMAKYPTLQRDGLDAQALLLWRHPAGDWRYAALIADQRRPGQTCVAASFSAAPVALTAAILRKYFFASGERS